MATPSEVPSTIRGDVFTTYSDMLQAAALVTTRLAASSLPADISFHRSIDPALARDVDTFSDRVLALVNKLVHTANGKTSRIQEEEDIMDEFVRNCVDPMEGMLESTDSALDVFLGKTKEPAIHVPVAPVDPRQNKPKKHPPRGRLDPALTHASHIPKPQLFFKHTLSNTDESPYLPATLIQHKWCAKLPLGYVFGDEGLDQSMGGADGDDDEQERKIRTLHPYYYELTHPSFPDHVFNPPAQPSLPPSLDALSLGVPEASHPLTFVSTPRAFLSMANTISSETELAVDLEHHSYRSYKGFLALMQISTRYGDFVVDLLVPEIREGLRQGRGKNIGESQEVRMASEAGQIIARVFADPSVIKVFHGAESDIVWLQQDFNIFVVGLFDTFHASKLLEFPKHSLAYLLETYCDFIPDKRYQLADWRIRPLPVEMSDYARSDTHFLLYIYDMLRRSLLERAYNSMDAESLPLADMKETHHRCSLIHSVLSRSSRTALRLYNVEVYDEEGGTGSGGWNTLARKWNKPGLVGSPSQVVQGPQMAVYKTVHRWREDVAREEDESTRYVLPTHYLFLLAERVPATVPDLLSLFGGPGDVHRSVPSVLKRRAGELVTIIRGAMEVIKLMSSPTHEATEIGEDTERVVSTVVEEAAAMGIPIPTSLAAMPTSESRLWGVASSSMSATTISISRSSLLGLGFPREDAKENGIRIASQSSLGGRGSYSATGSVLFGSALPEPAPVSSPSMIKSTFTYAAVSDDSGERFKDLMEKIHKTLVIAPVISISSIVPSVKTQVSGTPLPGTPTNVGMEQNDSAILEASDLGSYSAAGQIEIPFIPAHKRQTISSQQCHELKNDTIVIVGQVNARQRKRKRDQAKGVVLPPISKSGTRVDGTEASTSTGDRGLKTEEFDYSNIPNLLDEESMREDVRDVHEENQGRKRRRGKGSGLFEYGNFRAPPKDQREVRSGNKAHTFR